VVVVMSWVFGTRLSFYQVLRTVSNKTIGIPVRN
jgi:hypothetical protein